ncbi:MAG: hypothetical protein MUE85_04330 [Microscillaceae bacterium]|jgi:hypothetical protein|nr:hypothetical protein [Microscillaceae bacterium]
MESFLIVEQTQKLQLVRELPFLMIYFNAEQQIFELYWRRQNFEMSQEEFKSYIDQFSQLFQTYKARGFYVDTRAYHITMDIELQAWHDRYIVPRYLAGGVQKIAFVLPYCFISSISIEQAFDEPQARQLQVKYFEDEARARAWISL